uniref:Uncharacterized protein n=1 Tax=Zea mays TaxID=4577 RepID=C4J8E1_MAIZE|nr:unknown [Zea mays]
MHSTVADAVRKYSFYVII